MYYDSIIKIVALLFGNMKVLTVSLLYQLHLTITKNN